MILRIRTLILAAWVCAASMSFPIFAQDITAPTKEISNEELKRICASVNDWTNQAVDLRKKSADMAKQDFLSAAEKLRLQYEKIVLTIAATRPTPRDQNAAMVLAMGTKGAELALWHFIFGSLNNSVKAFEYGDTLLKTASGQVDNAWLFFQKKIEY